MTRSLALAFVLLAARAHAQEQGGALGYGAVDRATVRVFAVRGVTSARVESQSGVDRLLAIPEAGHGSGLMISDQGLVLTAAHVVEDARLLAVWSPGESRAYAATVVYADPRQDLAFLAVRGAFAHHVEVAAPSTSLRVRQTVHAIGYPIDARRTDPQSSRGIISGVLPSGELQLDMALNPGNSGGPLIDEQENVVGIVVARGDPNQGVQNIGIAVPIETILRAIADHVQNERVALARSTISEAVGDDVAELVTILARVGAAELIREVMDVVDHQGRGEVLPRLRTLADRSRDADVLSLTAAYLWDTAAVILERNGGVMRPSQLPPGPDRQVALDLLQRSVALCRQAAQIEPTLAARSPFVAHVLHYLASVNVETAAPEPPPFVPPPPEEPRTALPQPEAPREPPRPRGPDYRTHLGAAVSFPHQAAPGFGIGGITASFNVVASPYTLRAGIVAADLWLGGRFHLGYWDSSALIVAGIEIGAGMRIGQAQAATFGITYAPAVVFGENRASVAPGGVRAYAGAYFDPVTIAVGWEAIGPPDGYAIHLYQILVSFGL